MKRQHRLKNGFTLFLYRRKQNLKVCATKRFDRLVEPWLSVPSSYCARKLKIFVEFVYYTKKNLWSYMRSC